MDDSPDRMALRRSIRHVFYWACVGWGLAVVLAAVVLYLIPKAYPTEGPHNRNPKQESR